MFGLFKKKPPQYSPQQVGYIIAGGLHYACAQATTSCEQLEWMRTADIGVDILQREVTCLAGFAAEWGFFIALREKPECDLVRVGYWDNWREFAAQSKENKAAFDLLPSRSQKYAQAALLERGQPGAVIGNPITDQFSDFLSDSVGIDISSVSGEDDSIAIRLGHIQVLAALTAPTIFDVYFEMAVNVLSENGLSRPLR